LILKDNNITIRKMEDDLEHYSLIYKWLNNPQVLEYCYCEEENTRWTYEKVKEYFSRKLINPGRYIVPCIIEYNNKPVGFLQYYVLTEKDKQYYKIDEIINVYGMDIFIGETEYWNKGLGTEVFTLVIAQLFNVNKAKKIVIDPEAWNERAIKCYEKSGFRKIKILKEAERHKGINRDCWLMEITREEFLNNNISIRKATSNDINQLVELRWQHEYEEEKECFITSKDEFVRECTKFLKDGLDKNQWVYWIAEKNKEIIANIYVKKIRKVPKPQKLFSEIGYVTNVYTKAQYRNKGIGSKLLGVVKEWARENELELLFLWPSEKSESFYNREGFVKDNEIIEYEV